MNEVIRDIFRRDFDEVEKRGIQKGIEEGIDKTNERVAMDMLREKYPLSAIEKISQLSEGTIRHLANTLGVAVL